MEELLKELTLDYFGEGRHKITPANLFKMEKAVFLDVRSKEENETLHIHLRHHKNIKILNIPLDELPQHLDEIPKDIPTGIFCPANVRSTIAMVYLMQEGYKDVRIVEGGYAALTDEMKPGKVLKLKQER